MEQFSNRKRIFLLLLILAVVLAFQSAFANGPLPTNQAFRISASMKDSQTLVVSWKIAPDYYLYKDHLYFQLASNHKNQQIGNPILPHGELKYIPQTGNKIVYENIVSVAIPIIQSQNQTVKINVSYQGCSKKGFCYPPITKQISIQPNNFLSTPIITGAISQSTTENPRPILETQSVFTKNPYLIIGIFFALGLTLSFTPCVLPMIPILSGIIIGQHQPKTWRAFQLSLAYVFGMSITYTFIGIFFGYLGMNLQVILQKPLVVIALSLLLAIFALMLFDIYHLKLFDRISQKLSQIRHTQRTGRFFGVMVMGMVSTLVLSPCVTPPLAAALTYISKHGSILHGGTALFFMGLGMGVPLLLFGTFGAKVLPRSGPWMIEIKRFMGFILFALAIWLLQRAFVSSWVLILWAALFIAFAIYLGVFVSSHHKMDWIKRIIGCGFFIYAILLLIGAWYDKTSVLAFFSIHTITKNETSFITVFSPTDLQNQLALPQHRNKLVIIDFYADWCVACKVVEKRIFQNTQIKNQLKNFVLIRADITKNSDKSQLLMKAYNVIAPPTIIFLNKDHQERTSVRVVGDTITIQEFLTKLKDI